MLTDFSPYQRVGFRVTPQLIAELLCSGFQDLLQAVICNPLPRDFKLQNYGYDSMRDEFFFIFARPEAAEGCHIEWYRPRHEKAPKPTPVLMGP